MVLEVREVIKVLKVSDIDHTVERRNSLVLRKRD